MFESFPSNKELLEKREDVTHWFLDPRRTFQQEEKVVLILALKCLKNIRDYVQISILILNEFQRINSICGFLMISGEIEVN